MAQKAKHAYGTLERVDENIANGKIDAYDVLFVKDADGKPYVGWVSKDGEKQIVDPYSGVNELGNQIEEKLATKIDSDEVDIKITTALDNFKPDTKYSIKYLVSDKPEGTLVDYRESEIRIMIPSDTQWQLRPSGENADKNKYYIGVKIYAISDEVVSFKEDMAEIINDETMYYFVDNEFAGEDENGKYSIIWLPVAKYDESSDTWTYYGANSKDGKFIGWYYSVEWFDVNEKVIASNCIRINLANEDCFSSIKPYYMSDISKEIDTKIEEKVAEMESAIEIIEF